MSRDPASPPPMSRPPDSAAPSPCELRASVAHTEVARMSISRADYLSWAESAPLQDVLGGRSDLPAVVSTEPISGTWNHAGARRRIVLDDGGEAIEEVLVDGLQPSGEHVFRYRVTAYTHVVRWVIDHAIGEFVTSEPEPGAAEIRWTYRYHPRSALLRPAVALFVRRTWAPYMREVLAGMVAAAERA